MPLVEPGFNERDRWNEMVQDVLSIDIVDFDLFVGEDLQRIRGFRISAPW